MSIESQPARVKRNSKSFLQGEFVEFECGHKFANPKRPICPECGPNLQKHEVVYSAEEEVSLPIPMQRQPLPVAGS